MDARPGQRTAARRVAPDGRHRAVTDDARPDRGFRHARSDGPLRRLLRRDWPTAARRAPVRIAVLGDSFIEGDILTADLREKLQQAYGGGGAGFAPMASPLTAFRRTIKHPVERLDLLQHHAAQAPRPQNLRERLLRFGLGLPALRTALRRAGKTPTTASGSTPAPRRGCFFISPGESRVELTLNDSLRREFDGRRRRRTIRQIAVTAPHVRSLAFKVLSGTEGFIGYGAVFEADGVVVDNYSVRSNNGQAMFWTNPSVNAQIERPRGVRPGDPAIRTQHHADGGAPTTPTTPRQIEKMVALRAQCFPDGGRAGAGRQRPFGEDRRGFRTRWTPCPDMLDYQRGRRRTHRRGLLADLRRHAFAGRHGTVRRQRLGRQGLSRTSTTPAAVAWPGRSSMRSTPGRSRSLCASGSRTHPPAGRAGRARQPRGRRRIERDAEPRAFRIGNPQRTAGNDTPRRWTASRKTCRRCSAYDASSPLHFQQRAVPVSLRRVHASSTACHPPCADGRASSTSSLFSLYFYYKSSGIYFLLLIFAATSATSWIAQGHPRTRARSARKAVRSWR